METTITQNDLCRLTLAIWESTLGLEVRPIPGTRPADRNADTLVGRVQFSGARRSTVLLECSRELARKVARVMFGLDAEEPTSEQVRDALAEMANITAGNLKSLTCGHCHLSTPQVSECVLDPPIRLPNVVICRQAFDCQDELFVLTLLEG